MIKISGFTFIHNAVSNGLPVFEAIKAVRPYCDEVIVVNTGSTDETEEYLRHQDVIVYDVPWNPSRDYLNDVFKNHVNYCSGDVILFFEGDEVWSDSLLTKVWHEIKYNDLTEAAVYRLQIGQNFQRCRWYPISVHRIFKNGSGGTYVAHPTSHPPMIEIPPEFGFVWDCSNCFRDNIANRRITARELWGEPRRLYVRDHFTQPVEVTEAEEKLILQESHWLWKSTPFAIPDVLKPLVGTTTYRPTI